MNQPIKILYVDDNPHDRALVRHALERAHGGFQVTEAASRREFEAQLAVGGYDLVLSDFDICEFDGLDVLAIVQDRRPGLPVVIVTGTGSEEAAVEVMKRGVADYVIKSTKHIQRLPQTILAVLQKRELEQARQQAEDAVLEMKQRLEYALDAGQLGVWDLDLSTGMAWRSLQHDRIFGYATPLPTWTHAIFLEHVLPEDRQPVDAAFRRAIADGSEWRSDCRIRWPDGAIRWIAVQGKPQWNARHEVVRMLGLVRDITAEKQVLVELAEARKVAEAASRVKSEFLARMSHKLRNPSSSVLGALDLLMHPGGAGHDKTELLAAIQTDGRVLADLLNGFLDFSQIEADRVPIVIQLCSLRQLVQEVLSMTRVRAQEKQLAVVVECDPLLPDLLLTDPGCLRQILVHLVRNAFDFTDRGAVRIVTRGQSSSDGMLRLEISVSDTGVGIPPERLQEVFQPLEPAGGLRTRRYGVGVGLAISQRLAHALGGDLRVQSEIEWGSTFTLSIPVALPEDSAVTELTSRGLAQAGPTIPPTAARPRSGRILLVDDAPGVRFVIAALLKRLGLEVDAADDVAAGCEMMADSLAEGRPYDLILIDLEMPAVRGLGAARHLRQEGWRGPLVALTAHALAGDRERCLAAGCDDYLSKPVTGSDLEQMIDWFMSGETRSMPPANENAAV